MHTPITSHGPETAYPRDTGLDELFRRQVANAPDQVAVIYGPRRLTYRELDRQADGWAQALLDARVGLETPVGLLLEPGLEQVVLQVAIIRAGATCVPLDPAQPDARLQDMLDFLGSDLLVTSDKWASRLSLSRVLHVEQHPSSEHPVSVPTDGQHRTHVLHTSGSTGKPKAVQMVARGISRLVLNRDFAPLFPTDRIAHVSNPTFDASLYEIWGALLNGATLVILPKQTVIDPFALKESLRSNGITSICITTALFNLTSLACPDAFKGVRNVLVGGEAANAHAMREVLIHSAPGNLRNAYGPTESTTYAITFAPTLADLEGGSVSIGRAIDNTQAYILDEQLRPVAGRDSGNLYLGGDGLVRGYWNQDELNRERFVAVALEPDTAPVRLYHTGDIARWNADGTIDYLGRADNQVKLHGHRIELEEIESALLSSGQLQGAVVDLIKPESALAEPYLLAYVVPGQPSDFDLQALENHLANRLPPYMLPRIERVASIALNANGKADRKALRAHRGAARQATIAHDGSLLEQLSAIWREVLDQRDIEPGDNFFELGGSSLKAASLVIAVARHFKQALSVQALYEHPTLQSLADYLDARLKHGAGLKVVDEIAPLREDARLADDLRPLPGPLPEWRGTGEGRVFVTGVTGFLGAFFLHDLLQLDGVVEIACLVRAADEAEGLARLRDNMEDYGLWRDAYLPRLQALPGDLSDTHLGLGEQGFDRLAGWASVVFHLGAHVNYTQPYATHRPANILGTLNVLRLANSIRPKALHYVSSIACYGPTGFFSNTRELHEHEPLEPHLHSLKYDTGYSQSQWVAEQLVWNAHRNGLPVAIYRPGFIMGDSSRGHGNTKDFVARLIKGCVAVGAYPILPKQSKEFISVDYVSHALLTIASDNANLGHAYNLVPLEHDERVDLMGLFDLLDECGYPLKGFPYRDWVKLLEQDRGLHDNPLLPLLPMLSEPVYGELTRWQVYENMPVYRTDNVRRVLGSEARSSTLNRGLLQQYLASWRKRGFLPEAEEAPSQKIA